MTIILDGTTGITSPADSLSGNLTFTGTGNRITGDFSNATIANRVAFQTSTANGNTVVGVIPNGTGLVAGNYWLNNSDPTNAGAAYLRASTTDITFQSTISGTGTYLPMTFYTGGSERMRIDTSGNVGIGTNSPSSYPGKLSVIGDGIVTDYDLISRVSSSLADADRGFKQITDGTGQFSIYSPNGGGVVFGVGSSYTERMRIDSSGNVGIGTSTPNTKLQVDGVIRCNAVGGEGGHIEFLNTTNSAVAGLVDVDAANNTRVYALTNNPLIFGTNSTERARIDSSGNLLVGTTNSTIGVSGIGIQTRSNPGNPLVFLNSSGAVAGYVQVNNTTTSYGTSSDYRLKENIAPMEGALSVVAQLKPCTYTWKADGSDGQGFIAHELQAVVPDCVTGEKDAVDAEGNPVYQGIDTSFLVATLTAAIQEQQAIIEQLRADVAQLKGTQA